jgi:hypothetical protein
MTYEPNLVVEGDYFSVIQHCPYIQRFGNDIFFGKLLREIEALALD